MLTSVIIDILHLLIHSIEPIVDFRELTSRVKMIHELNEIDDRLSRRSL
jgi:hypothetical protein